MAPASQPTGSAAAAFGMPMPLASLMANGNAGDAITLRIVWVAAATTVTATRPRGGWSKEGEIFP